MCLFMLLMLNMSLYIYEICLSTIGFYCSIHTRMDMRKSLKSTKSFCIHMPSFLLFLLSFFVGRHQHIKVKKEEVVGGGGFIQQLSLKSFSLEERIYNMNSFLFNTTLHPQPYGQQKETEKNFFMTFFDHPQNDNNRLIKFTVENVIKKVLLLPKISHSSCLHKNVSPQQSYARSDENWLRRGKFICQSLI